MDIRSKRLTQHQIGLLLAIVLVDDPKEAKNIAHRTARTVESVRVLLKFGMVELVGDEISVTPTGFAELLGNGYIDDSGEATEFGQQFYQHTVASLNEFYIIGELLLHD